MSHDAIRICAEHKKVQLRCRCPEPITTAIEEECKHGELTDEMLFWDDATKKIVRGRPVVQTEPETATILKSDVSITYKVGDLFESTEPALAHGCNTHGVMGAGVARIVRQRHPEAFYAYTQACDMGRFRLGSALPVYSSPAGDRGRWIYNLATQVNPGADATLWGVFLSFANMAEDARVRGIDAVGIPRIGCGIGGLTWDNVEPTINAAISQSTHPGLNIVVYDLEAA